MRWGSVGVESQSSLPLHLLRLRERSVCDPTEWSLPAMVSARLWSACMLYFMNLTLAKVNMASPMRDLNTFLVTPRPEHVPRPATKIPRKSWVQESSSFTSRSSALGSSMSGEVFPAAPDALKTVYEPATYPLSKEWGLKILPGLI